MMVSNLYHMKTITLIVLFCCVALISKAQDSSVEKSIFGIQLGAVGVWAQNEFKLAKEFAFRTELGLRAGFGKNYYYLGPEILIEPRWYYNLVRRDSKTKEISNNSGNYIFLLTGFSPDWVIITNSDNLNADNALFVIPSWGLKRNLGDRFNFEIGGGVGYSYSFVDFEHGEHDIVVNVHLRIGFKL